MGDKHSSFFNIYSENPESCGLAIMTIGDKLVARALVWKLNSIKSNGDKLIDKPEYFMDRIYYTDDYQLVTMKNFAKEKGWSFRKSYDYDNKDLIIFNDKDYKVSMSVKVKKSNYDDTYPYMDTFSRYDHFSGLLWNDKIRRKGGHILVSTQGTFEPSISKRKMYINRFKDLFKNDNDN